MVVDSEKTEQAQAQKIKILEKWNSWLFENVARANYVEKQYNHRFNRITKPVYDGEFITVKGMVSESVIKLDPHQKNAIFRSVCQKGVFFDHDVGMGKTFTMIASVMKNIELGNINKAMIATIILCWERRVTELFNKMCVCPTSSKTLLENSVVTIDCCDFLIQG